MREAFENSIKVNAAIGGSTNFIVHLLAIAGRVGVDLDLDDFDRLGSQLPLLVNLMPAGKYLMEDFYYAGGLPSPMWPATWRRWRLSASRRRVSKSISSASRTRWSDGVLSQDTRADGRERYLQSWQRATGLRSPQGPLRPDGKCRA